MTDAETTAPVDRLIEAGLRPTRQRVALARLLFDGGDRHVTAEALHGEATAVGQAMALATVYNTLHQFTEAGRSYFDTNIRDHHHFYHESTGVLRDVHGEAVVVSALPEAPAGTRIARVDVVIRLTDE